MRLVIIFWLNLFLFVLRRFADKTNRKMDLCFRLICRSKRLGDIFPRCYDCVYRTVFVSISIKRVKTIEFRWNIKAFEEIWKLYGLLYLASYWISDLDNRIPQGLIHKDMGNRFYIFFWKWNFSLDSSTMSHCHITIDPCGKKFQITFYTARQKILLCP